MILRVIRWKTSYRVLETAYIGDCVRLIRVEMVKTCQDRQVLGKKRGAKRSLVYKLLARSEEQ